MEILNETVSKKVNSSLSLPLPIACDIQSEGNLKQSHFDEFLRSSLKSTLQNESNQPYFFRLNLWLKERFPLINFISGFMMYLMARAVVDLTVWGTLRSFHWQDVAGLMVPALHLFLLRVFDEHKDFEIDRLHYPHRILQRGIFRLNEVRNLGIIAFVLQLSLVLMSQPIGAVWITYGVLWAWTLLMTKEFFIKDWLKNHLLIYGVLHLVITPVLLLFLLSFSANMLVLSAAGVWTLALSALTAWLYELSRKIKAPDEETGDLSYSKLWGIPNALIGLALSSAISTIVILAFFWSCHLRSEVLYAIPALILLLHFKTLLKFYHAPSIANRKKNEAMVLLISSYAFIVPIVASWWR